MASKRVLIVDDEENIGRSLRLILERDTGAWNTIWGMQRCTIWRHVGKTATAPVSVPHDLLGWHIPVRAAINVGFADGHAQPVRVKDLWSLYWHDQWTASGPPR